MTPENLDLANASPTEVEAARARRTAAREPASNSPVVVLLLVLALVGLAVAFGVWWQWPPAVTPPALVFGEGVGGWHEFPTGAGRWQVQDGLLVSPATGRPAVLVTDRDDFADFHLHLECRLDQPDPLYVYAAAELPDGDGPPRGWSALVYPGDPTPERLAQRGRADVRPAPDTGCTPGTRVDEWVTLEVIVANYEFKVLLNGKQTQSQSFDSATPRGRIALYRPRSESRLEVRKVELRELPPPPSGPVAGPDGLAPYLAGTWRAEPDPRDYDETVIQCEAVAGGKIVRGSRLNTDGVVRSLFVWNPVADAPANWWDFDRRHAAFPRRSRTRWSQKEQTLTWVGDPWAIPPSSRGADRHRTSWTVRDADTLDGKHSLWRNGGPRVEEWEWSWKRMKGDAAAPGKDSPGGQEQWQQFAPLDSLAGEWQCQVVPAGQENSPWAPRQSERVSVRFILDGQLLEARGETVYWLLSRTPERWRLWYFDASSAFEMEGQWDPNTRTLRWREPRPGGTGQFPASWHLTGANEWQIVTQSRTREGRVVTAATAFFRRFRP